jgi:hypothetical protein
MSGQNKQAGSTLVELVIGTFLLSMIGLAFFGLFTALVGSAITAKLKSSASTLATNQMEYIKSLPYDELAVAGGSIYSADPLPATKTETVNNHTYTIKTSINYVDNAYDGCANYPTPALKQKYCRNFPSPAGAPNPDTNPQDYKVVNVSVYSRVNAKLAEVDTQIAARVAETNSNTGSLFVSVLDNTGAPVQGSTVQITNSTLNPLVDLSDETDADGNALFYGLPPDTSGFDYAIRATKEGYSSLSTIKSAGSLQATYPNQNIFAQQASYVTLPISPQNANSMAIESVDINGNPLGNVNVYAKGGYKRYSLSTNTAYYYDNLSPTDTRFTTNASGLASLKNLAPGDYFFCGDDGGTSCRIGISTYYLAAAVPYTGSSILSPILVPNDSPSPNPTYPYLGDNFLQKTRLIFTPNATAPRITSSSVSEASKSSGTINNFAFQLKGKNLPCSSSAASCSTVVVIKQGASNFPASCIGNATGAVIDCTVNLSSAAVGATTFSITANGSTLNLPGEPLRGGINVIP